jgi:nucleotide-binding universal stress UspA family protein
MSSLQSAELVSKLAFSLDSKITVLGVSESIDDLENLAVSMDQINKSLGSTYTLDRKIRSGDPIEEIMSEAVESSYDLVAVGGGSGQLGLLHPQLGSTTRKLARKLHTHFLVARNVPEKIRKILICTGANVPANRTMKLGGEWISNSSAKIGLLHVRSPEKKSSVEKSRPGSNLQSSAQKANDEKDAILTQALHLLREAGVKNEVVTQLRIGSVVEEVLKEIIEVGYELLVIGAHYQPGQDRWQGTLLDDVTDKLLNRSLCSVLII